MQAAVATAKQEAPAVSPWLIAFTVMLSTFMEVLDTSVANVSLPHIAGNLSAGVEESTWVLTSYLVANAVVLPLSGWLSTLFGRRRFYMTCVLLFTVSSLFCGLAPNLGLLVFFRVLQGIGGGALQPTSQAILVESFPRHKYGMAMAVYGMGVVLAPIIGPTLGGWITDNYSWRWIFLINIPVGMLSLLLSSLLLVDPPHLRGRKRGDAWRIDFVGLGFIAVGLGFLQVMLDLGERRDWFGDPQIICYAVIAGAGIIGAVIWEWFQKEPMVDLHLLKERNFALATCTMFVLGIVLYGSTVLLPLMLQILLGYTATLAGLAMSPGGLAVLFLMPLVGRLLGRFEARWLVLIGITVTSLSLLHMSGFNLQIDFRTAMRARIYQSMGMAFLFVPINTVAFYFMPKQQVNRATGIINLARNIGGGVGIALVTTLLARRAQVHQNALISHLTPMDERYREAVAGASRMLVQFGSDPVRAMNQATGMIYGVLQRQAAMLAFLDCFWLLGVLFLSMTPLIFLMKRAEPHQPGQ